YQIPTRSHPVNTSESFAHPTRHQASGNWHPAKFPRVGCISVIPQNLRAHTRESIPIAIGTLPIFFIFPGSGFRLPGSPHRHSTTPRRDLRSGGSPPRKGGDHATCPSPAKHENASRPTEYSPPGIVSPDLRA